MFIRAVDYDLILYDPFDGLSGGLPHIEKDWHYVTMSEFRKLCDACPNQGWKTLLAICRLAGLRQGEALALQRSNVDWERNWLVVWGQNTKRRRVAPIAPKLLPILRSAFEQAGEGNTPVVSGVTPENVWRDFGVIRKRAGIPKYAKWCHTLRENRESDWITAGFPFHVVIEWMGHSDDVARHHYLRVNEGDMRTASQTAIPEKLTQLDVSEVSAEEEHEPHNPETGRL